jgi:hypothetical protein
MKTSITTTTSAPSTEEEYVLPCAEALLAGTLALMTAYAQGSPHCNGRPVMAAQLVSNLIRLSHHPAFTPTMRAVLSRLCGSWQQQVSGITFAEPTEQSTALWHGTPQSVQ